MSTATTNESIPVAAGDVWEIEVTESKSGDFAVCPAGSHPGRVCGIFDVGHQPDTRTDKKTGAVENIQVRKLVLVYELTERQPDGSPFVMADRLTWSMNDRSNFFELVKNVTGQVFATGQKFNPTALLGKPVMVGVIHKPGKENKTYANIGSVQQFPKAFPVPAFVHEPVAWSVREGRPFPAGLGWLPHVYGKAIDALASESAEGRGLALPAPGAGNGNGNGTPAPAPGRHATAATAPPSERVLPLLHRYGIAWPYTNDDLDRLARLVAPADMEVLREEAPIPF